MISAFDIADALGRPRPTEQQCAVIEAPLTPALVVAGAGSGKTETMANRVLWLLANGQATAGQVLGLTFTRKAAGELSVRIRERIAQLEARGLAGLPPSDAFDPPTVATYNSFANTIFRDNAILLGRESDGAVLGEASAWQLARSVVVSSTDERLMSLGRSVDTLTKDVLTLSRAMSENVVEPSDIVAMAHRFAAVADLPAGGTGRYADVDRMVEKVAALPVLVELAERFAEAKRRRGFVEYSDQVALALQIVRGVPSVAAEFRDRYRVVLLDEYQDTSVVQTWLLAELFADHAVMAVGDPNQSIYGWRGASAANLEDFGRQFRGAVAPVNEFALSTSWRNGHDILAVANALVEPLVDGSRVRVERLGASPAASALPVDVSFHETLAEGADSAARWLREKLRTPQGVEPPSASMLFRARKTQPVFIEALRRHGVPFHVLGVGGLLAEPEIADLVCALTVVGDPSAGSELVRLLAGSHWRIGVRDLKALRGVSSWLAGRDYAHRRLDEQVRLLLRNSVADGEGGSIVDALEFIQAARPDHSALSGFSPAGLERLRHAGGTFARLRARSGLDLLDFVTLVQQELLLDIEVIANDSRATGGAAMDAFFDALSGYLAVDESASLGGFLGWLREAEWRDSLAPRPEEPEPGTVQLMTIHGAKGLEHDLVVVPRFVDGELPGASNEGYTGWLSFGALPYEFRGDSAELPVFEWDAADSRKKLVAESTRFSAAVRERHELEERRLAYVAVTRARHSLLLSGSFWAGHSKPRGPSGFLVPLAESGVIGPLPASSASEENPLGDDRELLTWPMDPLGNRRAAVERAAAQVRAAAAELRTIDPDDPNPDDPWARDLHLLIAERRRRLGADRLIDVPERIPASRFKDFVTTPGEVASALRRPMPERPYRATRLGTLFHQWVEERYGIGGGSDMLDASGPELDLDLDLDRDLGRDLGPNPDPTVDDTGQSAESESADLERLQRTFEASPWAGLRAVDVEREIHLPLAGQVIVCKIDAVYFDGERYQVVDWKTGKAPRDAADLERKQLQLALYRLAYAHWKGIDPALIDAVFYFVSDDVTIVPERLFDEAELTALWNAALTS
ncbi:MAG: ATP-dependent helicase [Burkholderiaceae bacterium]|nr:ATP-dependent helicase [Microbacteriaceae bacterium]